jgi:hypothetical protein
VIVLRLTGGALSKVEGEFKVEQGVRERTNKVPGSKINEPG